MLKRFFFQAEKGLATIAFVFGTRPEAIKLAPLVNGVLKHRKFGARIVVTSQHREMLDQVLDLFEITPDIDLDLMQANQTLLQIASRTLDRLEGVISKLSPDLVMVQGDTLTAFCAALSAYFVRIPVAHVEAGLRTWDKFNPFPEEMNRVLLARIADLHFSPTESSKNNLLREGVSAESIYVTGNTVIDAVQEISRRAKEFSIEDLGNVPFKRKRVLLVTAHRRESFGERYREICTALRDIVRKYPDVHIVFPYHLNPNAARPAKEILGREPSVTLVPPVPYPDLVLAMCRCWAVLTDSGGIQEEAPSFGKPVLVLREKTERPEAIAAGTVKLAGNRYASIREAVQTLLEDPRSYESMCRAVNPYGDGKAVGRILEVLETGILRNPFGA